jgi:hypothetical protein
MLVPCHADKVNSLCVGSPKKLRSYMTDLPLLPSMRRVAQDRHLAQLRSQAVAVCTPLLALKQKVPSHTTRDVWLGERVEHSRVNILLCTAVHGLAQKPRAPLRSKDYEHHAPWATKNLPYASLFRHRHSAHMPACQPVRAAVEGSKPWFRQTCYMSRLSLKCIEVINVKCFLLVLSEYQQ